MAKKSVEKIDGLSPDDVKKIRIAIRRVWSWTHPRRLCVSRCTDSEGYPKCEECNQRCPKIFVDHVTPVGDVDSGFIERLFVPSNMLRGLCKKCHQAKTNAERRALRGLLSSK